MEKFIWILVFFSLKAYGEAQPVQEPTEIHELSVTEQGYKKIWDRFQRLNAMNQSEWTKSSGRWLQTEFWPEPNKLKSLLGVNPEEFVVEASPTLKVTKNFFTSDEKNFGTFSIFKIPDVQKWKCLGAELWLGIRRIELLALL
ncbi:hypothetical protein K2X30_08865 [bacterium]|nr:hypothetical protein [bacterium]